VRDLLFALHAYFFSPILTIVFFAILAYVIMGWLFTFGVVSQHNPTARQIYSFLDSAIYPLIRPIRKIVPPLGQLDLSVLLLALIILFTRDYALPRLISFIPF